MKVKLNQAVIVAGTRREKGQTVDVPEPSARWLIEQEAAVEASAKPAAKPAKES